MSYHTEHQYRCSGYHQCGELSWFCVCYMLQKSKMRNMPCSQCSYAHFSDIQMHLTVDVTTPLILYNNLGISIVIHNLLKINFFTCLCLVTATIPYNVITLQRLCVIVCTEGSVTRIYASFSSASYT